MKRFSARTVLLSLGMLCLLACSAQAQGVDVAKYFPDNTEMAFSFNVKSVLNSQLFQKHFKDEIDKQIKENTQLQKMMESLSFDPMKDIISVAVTVSKFSVNMGAMPEWEGFMVARGAFNVEKMNGALGALIAAANQSDRVTTSKYGDFLIYEVKDSNSKKTFYATIYDKETIFGSTSKDDITNAIERATGRKTASMNNKFSELMSKARNDNTMWGAMVIPASIRELAKRAPNPDMGDAISKLEAQTMSFHIKDNVKFDVSMYMTEDGAAKQLKEMMDQFKDMASAVALANEQIGAELAEVVNSLQIGNNGKKVSLSGEVKADVADKIVKSLKERGR